MLVKLGTIDSRDGIKEEGLREASGEFNTKIIHKTEEIIKQITNLAETSSGLSIVSVSGGLQLIYNTFVELYKNVLDKNKKGMGNGISWIISIDKESFSQNIS